MRQYHQNHPLVNLSTLQMPPLPMRQNGPHECYDAAPAPKKIPPMVPVSPPMSPSSKMPTKVGPTVKPTLRPILEPTSRGTDAPPTRNPPTPPPSNSSPKTKAWSFLLCCLFQIGRQSAEAVVGTVLICLNGPARGPCQRLSPAWTLTRLSLQDIDSIGWCGRKPREDLE
jgi:hypothetical protein